MACDLACRDEDCGHTLNLHTERSLLVGAKGPACSVDGCGCAEFIDADQTKCSRCGSWGGGLCVCYTR